MTRYDNEILSSIFGLAIGATVIYGGCKLTYKLFKLVFGSIATLPSVNDHWGRFDLYDTETNVVFVVNTVQKFNEILHIFKKEINEFKMLCFDCKWERDDQGVCVLCTFRGRCAIIQLSQLEYFPWELKEILEDRSFLKVGFASYTNAKRFHDYYGIRVANALDLSYMAHVFGYRPGGLKWMSGKHLGHFMNENTPFSNWSNPELNVTQIKYAADHVRVANKLFKLFFGFRHPNSHGHPGCFVEGLVFQQCRNFFDKRYNDSFFEKNIPVVTTPKELRNALEKINSVNNESNVLAFDCEWESSGYGRRKIAILQLCSHSGQCVIVQLLMFQTFPPELKAILENRKIIKIGVAPYTDAKFLFDDYGVRVTSTLDLRFMAHEAGCTPGGLKKMTETYLSSFEFVFDDDQQCSDWENPELSDEQIQYAATDVVAAYQLYRYFAEKIIWWNGRPDNAITEYCSKYINKNYGPHAI